MSRSVDGRRGSGLASRAEYRFGVVLLLLLATFVLLMAGSTSKWARPACVALTGATLLASFVAADVSLRLRRIAALGALVAFIAALSVATLGNSGAGASAVLDAALVVLAPIEIAKSVLRRRVFDAQTVLAALCIYVLFAMLWAFIYTAIASWGSAAFFSQTAKPTSADFLYFSFMTQLTVGYGDLTAAGSLGRACAVLQALLGEIYLVTVVAVLVSRVTPRSPRDASSA